METKLSIFLLTLFLLFGNYSEVASANAGPISYFPINENIIFFDEESNVSLVEATVKFSDFDDEWMPNARVTVNYTLKNIDDFDKDLTLYFVIPPGDDRKVKLSGRDITNKTEYQEIKVPENWGTATPSQIVNPVDGEVLATSYYDDPYDDYYDNPKGIVIPVKIGGNEEISLEIEYISHGGYYRGHINRIDGFMYYLTPAKFWEGETQLRLEVELGSSNYEFYSNIPLEHTEHGLYYTTLNKIPDTEWQISFFSTDGLLFGINNPSVLNKIVLAIIVSLYIVFLVFSIVKKTRLIFWIGHLVSGTLGFLYIIKINYPYSLFPPLFIFCITLYFLYLIIPKFLLSILHKSDSSI